jgi:hypothetical protein
MPDPATERADVERADEDAIRPEQRDRLIDVLHSLEDHVRRQNSLKFTFLKGAVYGLGTVVGASILVAIFGGLIATTVNSLSGEEVITETLETQPE